MIPLKWKRHRTPDALMRAFISQSGWKLKDVSFGNRGEISSKEWVELIRSIGMWGYAEMKAKPRLIHFWHDGKRSAEELLMLFGHEVGHCVGTPLKSGMREEDRADTYGRAAISAYKLLSRQKHRPIGR